MRTAATTLPSQSPAKSAFEEACTPTVSVVIPTYNRPQMMREALVSVLGQDYLGDIEVIIVFDKSEPDRSLSQETEGRLVRVIPNSRTPGLAGARNSGILAASGELVAFCDDDDTWTTSKLSLQVAALMAHPTAEFATTAMLVKYEDHESPRLAGTEVVTFAELIRSRMAMLHSSSFMARRASLTGEMGLVDEEMPRSMAEDWELLLRAAKRHPIVNVDQPLVSVRWGSTSYFASQWALRNEAQLRLIDKYPEILQDRRAASLRYGKLAFGEAAQDHRRAALRWARKAFVADPRQPRTYIAYMVAMRIMKAEWILRRLNERGHGI